MRLKDSWVRARRLAGFFAFFSIFRRLVMCSSNTASLASVALADWAAAEAEVDAVKPAALAPVAEDTAEDKEEAFFDEEEVDGVDAAVAACEWSHAWADSG